jgi:hypothetical protein
MAAPAPRPLLLRLAWFLGLWTAGVATVAGVAWAIRALLL